MSQTSHFTHSSDESHESHAQGTPHEHDRTPAGRIPRSGLEERPGDFNVTLITFAAMALYDALDGEQRARALLPFDDADRSNWNFLPASGRAGVPLRDLSFDQGILAHRLIAQCCSERAYAQVVQVISLEHVLRELNLERFGHVAREFRNPGMYFLTFFGRPNPDSVWGWRLVGHHLSLNFTVVNQDHLAVTPFLLGSEPARFGPYRVLGEEEDLGFALLRSLDDGRRARAIIHPVPPADFVTRTVPRIGEVELPDLHGVGRRDAMITEADRQALRYIRSHPRGIAAADLTSGQRRAFDELLECYLDRARPGQVAAEMDRVRAAGYGDLHFAWAGADDHGLGHYYRIQGPVTLIEFDNTEDDANHAHSVWRDPSNDFGEDLLMRHLIEEHRGAAG
ncbi:DUF3500 domain-containing protein [Streptosporangium vulgare]|uniref:DUF3500 domain-containing protein n=1 Tax=Streptosporangium vulgare TaxID=46190 RepID=A0ABV5TKE2_9ACTN